MMRGEGADGARGLVPTRVPRGRGGFRRVLGGPLVDAFLCARGKGSGCMLGGESSRKGDLNVDAGFCIARPLTSTHGINPISCVVRVADCTQERVHTDPSCD